MNNEELDKDEEISLELLEIFTQAAHELWMDKQLHDGWAYSHQTDNSRKLNSQLKPYELLTETEKHWYREQVVKFIEIIQNKTKKGE